MHLTSVAFLVMETACLCALVAAAHKVLEFNRCGKGGDLPRS